MRRLLSDEAIHCSERHDCGAVHLGSFRVWAQHRTTGKWLHVFAYGVVDDALYTGLFSYQGTQHLLAADFARCA